MVISTLLLDVWVAALSLLSKGWDQKNSRCTEKD